MPTAFLGCRAAVQAFEVGFDLFSCSRLNRTTRVHQLISRISPRDALKNCRRESLNLPISLREDELQTSKTVYSNSGETVDPIFNGKLPDTPAQLIVDLFISRQEECCMEVTEKATADAREEYGLPNSDDYKIAKKKLPKEMEKRPLARPQTVTSTGRPNVAAITSSPESHNPSAPVDFTDFSGETPLLALFSDILARPGGPTPHESRLLASVYNAAQCVEERNRSTAWEEWLQEPLDGHALYSPSPSPTGSDPLFLPSPGPESPPVSSPDSTPPVPVRRSKRTRAMVMDEDSDVVEIINAPSTTPLKLAIGPPGKQRKIIEKPSSDDEAIQHPNCSRSSSSDSVPLARPLRADKGKARTKTPPPVAGSSRVDKGKARARTPPTTCSSAKRTAVKPPVVKQKETSVQPKRRGRPRKKSPVIFQEPIVFDKKRFKCATARFGLKELPAVLKGTQIHMPEPCLQCSACKDSAVKNCTFRGWGTPCGPCDAAHVSSWAVRDVIRNWLAIHAPSGTVFETHEEFGLWYSFVQDFVDTQGVPVPAGSMTADLERLVSLFQRDDSPPIAGPSSLTPRQCRVCSLSLIPSIAVASPGLPPSAHSQKEEEEVIDELVDEE
ncbi:uncharacterized protein LACBIDRAFT_326647 [Laccaria bicolor S238N-H82]|uniref:Predicted protein n=1 Tax=Laccaria bicolor (strain S238N-H82 / ATCC MYA-4686) TaxID=486041 RepID=B0D9C0_LACBS|nr:uncharacterized protein LACBIDRAFT_326647 [Laccaria bicolor S238N-H82]EDR09221.1 predicted protein [Laccaria bicolor S238N-H82]|eukprot:XP_001880534.1 predicted protein [Laccaria bicolor S238N-H82]